LGHGRAITPQNRIHRFRYHPCPRLNALESRSPIAAGVSALPRIWPGTTRIESTTLRRARGLAFFQSEPHPAELQGLLQGAIQRSAEIRRARPRGKQHARGDPCRRGTRVWSPHLSILVSEASSGSRIRARVGPHPHIWGMFQMSYAISATLACSLDMLWSAPALPPSNALGLILPPCRAGRRRTGPSGPLV
jgi:hypothetical protein